MICVICDHRKDKIERLEAQMRELSLQCANMIDHKIRQIDENRKISKRVDELERVILDLQMEQDENSVAIAELYQFVKELERFQDITNLQYQKVIEKKPHACPVCGGRGGFYISGVMDFQCDSCEKGIVWG